MDIKRGILGLGFLGMLTVKVIDTPNEEKFYQPGAYYYSDNSTKVNYQSIYNGITEAVPSGFEYSSSSPDFNPIPKPLNNFKKIGNLANIFQTADEIDFSKAYDKSEYTFGFSKPMYVYTPLDCKVISISPNISAGIIPNFESYFTGRGVTVETLAENFNTDGNQIEIKITYSNLSKNWQSIGLNESYRDTLTNRELFYSNFVDGINYEFKAGSCLGETGVTGSYTETENCNNYVTISLEKRIKGMQDWKAMNFEELFTTL